MHAGNELPASIHGSSPIGNGSLISGDQDDRSTVTRECHAGICGSPGRDSPGPPDLLVNLILPVSGSPTILTRRIGVISPGVTKPQCKAQSRARAPATGIERRGDLG